MNHKLQQLLLDKIIARFSKKVEAVDTLAELLGTGKDAIYRRLRGDTLLTPEEIAKLAVTYNISLDALVFEKVDTVFFSFNSFTQQVRSFEDYLKGIKNNFDLVIPMPNVKLFYASAEIPIFHYCFFPELIAFKLFVWGRTIWDLEAVRSRPFSFDILPFPQIQLTQDLLSAYKQLDSVELWSLNVVDNTLHQIEYSVTSGDFANEQDALVLCDKLIALTHHQQNMATHGKKFLLEGSVESASSNFELFHNEMVYTNNTLFITSDVARIVYSAFSNPNFITSTDDRMCDYVESWFNRIINKSNSISAHSEKARNWFFNGLRRKINLTKSRIEHQIGEGI